MDKWIDMSSKYIYLSENNELYYLNWNFSKTNFNSGVNIYNVYWQRDVLK